MKKKWIILSAIYLSSLMGKGAIELIQPQMNLPKVQFQKLPDSPKTNPEPNLDGIVEVSFKIDNEGRVQIVNINSTSPQLADYVIKKLGKVKLEQGVSNTGKVIKYSFVFKKQA